MNPQNHGGQPPHQFQEPHMPIAPHPPTPEGWHPSDPTRPAPQHTSPTAAPEQNYEQPGHHAAGQQYEFILNPNKPVKKPSLMPSGNSLYSRLALVLGGVVILVIVIVIAASLLGGKGTNLTTLTTVAQDQTELARVANLAAAQSTTQDVANTAINTKLSMKSASQQLQDYLAKNGHKLDTKQLGLKLDKRTDTQLQTAEAASNFDSTFVSILQTQLGTYQRDLKVAYASNPGPKGRALLSSQYTGAGLLLKQLKQ